MRVYSVSLDGMTEAMVAAASIDAAAVALGTTVAAMRKAGWKPVKGSAAAMAARSPDRPFHRSRVGARPGKWTTDRSKAAAHAARAVLRSGRY